MFSAIILAAAGLKRLGMAERIRSLLAPEDSLPAAGQGALGIEIRAGRPEVNNWLAPLNHGPSAMAVTAERAVSRALGGSCDVPLAAYAIWEGADSLYLRSFVASTDGQSICRSEKKLSVARNLLVSEKIDSEDYNLMKNEYNEIIINLEKEMGIKQRIDLETKIFRINQHCAF